MRQSLKHYAFENAAVCLVGVEATREVLEPIFVDRERELLILAMCDDNLRLIRLLGLPGSDAQVTIPLPKIMRQVVESSCTGVVLAHNHTSSVLLPSQADLAFTKRVCIAAESMDITILDHLIFNCGPPFSFRQQGLL